MNIALVDDMPDELHKMESILKDYAALHHMKLSLSTYSGAEKLLADYRPLQYTVIFLDIYMNGMSGMDAAREIRLRDRDTLIVFLTTSNDHMPDAFQFHAYDYIRKPADPGRVFKLMDDILRQHTEMDEKRLTFNSKRENHSIPYADIVFIRTGTANYLEIMDKDGTIYKTRMTFSAIGDLLKEDNRFLLILRGIYVNMDYITSFERDVCLLTGGQVLPINIRHGKKIEQIWQNYLFNSIRTESRNRMKRT